MTSRGRSASPPPSPPPAGRLAEESDPPQCIGVTAAGHACQARPRAGSRYCFFHDPESVDACRAARRAGGRERIRPVATVAEGEADQRPQSVAEVTRLLGDTINRVRKGTLDVKIANTVGYLAGVLLRSLEVGELEDRLIRLEAVADRRPGLPSGAFNAALVDTITDDPEPTTEDLDHDGQDQANGPPAEPAQPQGTDPASP